ncbi:MAG: hypothetical protein HY569_01890 [Candidatus Magasanikbacteria bacterium]|nr:hypothetical protein [Candidatus Magasanikbacteria bacterium]
MYLKWAEETITDFSDSNINSLYNQGYLFTRVGKGVMNQTRSIRIDLERFKLTSENRRILKKTEGLQITNYQLPITNYHWSIGKMAKDFYDTKFGEGVFSANKVKKLLTDEKKSNFNRLLTFVIPAQAGVQESNAMDPRFHGDDKTGSEGEKTDNGSGKKDVGYAICLETDELLHYCYPFYVLCPTSYTFNPNTGLGMMLKAILWAKEQGKKHVYLGSAQRPTDTYKLQFEGLEWFDGEKWSEDLEGLKTVLVDRDKLR